jgi:hypothetical protein
MAISTATLRAAKDAVQQAYDRPASLSRAILIDLEGDSISVWAENAVKAADLRCARIEIAGCATNNVTVEKIGIPASTKQGLRKQYTISSVANSMPAPYNLLHGIDKFLEGLRTYYWGSTNSFYVFQTTAAMMEFLAPFEKPAEGQGDDAAILRKMLPKIREEVRQLKGMGRVFYFAWNNGGDQITLPPEVVEPTLKSLEKEGYEVTVQTTKFYNAYHTEREVDGDRQSVIMQATIIYTGVIPTLVDKVIAPIKRRVRKDEGV